MHKTHRALSVCVDAYGTDILCTHKISVVFVSLGYCQYIHSLSTKHISLGESENVLRTLSVHAQNSEGFVKSNVLLMTLSVDAKMPRRSLLYWVVADTTGRLCTQLTKLRFPDGLLLMTL